MPEPKKTRHAACDHKKDPLGSLPTLVAYYREQCARCGQFFIFRNENGVLSWRWKLKQKLQGKRLGEPAENYPLDSPCAINGLIRYA